MKKAPIIVAIIIALVVIVVVAGNLFNLFPSTNSITTQTPSTPSSTPSTTPQTPSIPSDNITKAPSLSMITFDFDHALPVLYEGQNIPFTQESNGLTATFSSPTDPAAFSIQSYDTTFYTLSQFSGKYLWDNKAVRNIVEITFSQMISQISLTFATVEYHGVGNVDEPSLMRLDAYKDSLLVGSSTAQGVISSDIYPEGTLSFTSSGNAFNRVTIQLASSTGQTTEFFIDNVIVQTAP